MLGVSRAGYYDWLDRPESKQRQRRTVLKAKIDAIHKDSHQIYGSPRIHGELVELGEVVGVNTVARVMREHGIQSKVHHRFVITTNSRHQNPIAENLLDRDFTASGPDQKWASDVTFIPTRSGWLYLATVMDLFSRKIIGWSMGARNSTQLICNALQMAIDHRQTVRGVLLHSDRGATYASSDYQDLLRKHEIICSMSRKGDCWDNAAMESFYHSLKTEWVVFEDYRTHDEAKASLFTYIELFYNRKRRHSTLGYLSPATYEERMCA